MDSAYAVYGLGGLTRACKGAVGTVRNVKSGAPNSGAPELMRLWMFDRVEELLDREPLNMLQVLLD